PIKVSGDQLVRSLIVNAGETGDEGPDAQTQYRDVEHCGGVEHDEKGIRDEAVEEIPKSADGDQPAADRTAGGPCESQSEDHDRNQVPDVETMCLRDDDVGISVDARHESGE